MKGEEPKIPGEDDFLYSPGRDFGLLFAAWLFGELGFKSILFFGEKFFPSAALGLYITIFWESLAAIGLLLLLYDS